jgi:hypothetical protein
MKSIRNLLLVLLGIGVAGPVTASSNHPEEPGSVLVFPKFIRGTFNDLVTGQAVHARTELEISVVCPTNASCTKGFPVRLRAHWVCPSSAALANTVCPETSFDLETTVNGSLYFNTEGVTVVDVAGVPVATAAAFPSNATTTIPAPPCERGYLIVWLVDGDGRAIKGDALIGNAVLRDGTLGEETISEQAYNAIAIQAGDGVANILDPTDLNGNGALDFDGREYQMVNGNIVGTVRYENLVATGGPVRTDLTLLTLDVRSNEPNPLTTVKLNFYTTDEDLVDTGTSFHCWREQRLTAINPSLFTQRMGRKGLVESTSATQQVDFFTTRNVTLLGIVETRQCVGPVTDCSDGQVRDYAYSLHNKRQPVPTAFVP